MKKAKRGPQAKTLAQVLKDPPALNLALQAVRLSRSKRVRGGVRKHLKEY